MEWEEYLASLTAAEVRNTRATKKADLVSALDLMRVTNPEREQVKPKPKPGQRDPLFDRVDAIIATQK